MSRPIRAGSTPFVSPSATLAGRRHDEIGSLTGLGIGELQSRALAGDTVDGYVPVEIDGVVHQQLVSLRPRVTADGTVIGVLAALHEIAAAANQQVIEEAPDQLTGIAGRATFLARVGSVLEASATGTAMFLLDIDNFKGINDLYGARVGDAVLKTVATRLHHQHPIARAVCRRVGWCAWPGTRRSRHPSRGR